ncbi:MAG: leucine-rich repeat domain-containing protein [Clostridia bacterium]|nr:leucine-rich repeat domain-containing protein [Clostridia bacterium]
MKKWCVLVFTIVIIMVSFASLSFPSNAQTNSGNYGSLTWEFDENSRVLTITGKGEMENNPFLDIPWNLYEDKIECVIIENGVTTISSDAFRGCYNLTSVEIPNSVTEIGSEAFSHCNNLTNITIPDSVTEIGYKAFYYCTNLQSVEIGCDVAAIGTEAFSSCDNLTYFFVNEHNTVYRSIDGNLYSKDGKNLIQYAIGKTAPNFVIPDGVTSISDSAFSGCDSLTKIVIPDSVITIESGAFYQTGYYNDESNWENNALYIDNCLIQVEQSTSGEYIIKPGTKTIAASAFYYCSDITSVEIPDSVVTIGAHAFAGSGLTSIEIPSSVSLIDSGAFWHCENLTSIKLPDSALVIEGSAFRGCWSLTSIEIPYSVLTIGDGAFSECDNLSQITFLSPNTIIEDNEKDSIYDHKTIPSHVTIYAYSNSKAEEYANQYHLKFVSLGSVPVTEGPDTDVPVTDAPVTNAPVTEAPTTEVPAMITHQNLSDMNKPPHNNNAPSADQDTNTSMIVIATLGVCVVGLAIALIAVMLRKKK